MFYKINSARVTLREYSWGTPKILLPIAGLLKLLGAELPGSSDDPNVESLEPFRITAAELPGDLREKFRPLEEQLRECGFVDPVYHWISDPFSATRICQATFRHESGTTFAKIHYRLWSQPKPAREYLFPFFVTSHRDGTFFISTAGRADMLSPPSCKVQRGVGASVRELWGRHSGQLSQESFGKTILCIYSQDEMLDRVERHHAAVRDFHVERGVFVPRSQEEERPIEAIAPAPQTEGDIVFAPVLAEIQRLEGQKAGWTNGILILIATAALFFGLGPPSRGLPQILMLAGVLLLHEFGHLAAMWLFRYRNLRMFFIPFLGAAVTGQNYNVPGWKKAVVSLMGPLPGIVLGAGLGIAAAILHWPMALEASLLLLGLNAFNLLPILPLDGGWLAHAVLFSRHPVPDVVFRLLAALALLASGLLGMKYLAILGVFMLLGLSTTYRLGKVVRRLRKSGFDATSPDACTIPASTARLIFDALRAALPARTDVKTSARLTLQAFESLNAKPPGWLGSLFLIGVHGGTFVGAVVIAAVLILARHGNLRDIVAAAAVQPKLRVDSGEVLAWQGADVRQAAGVPVNTIVGTFPHRQEAEAAYRDFTGRLPPRASATLFGQTVLFALPAEDDNARERWFNEIHGHCPGAFVDSAKFHGQFAFSCIAPTDEAAQALEEEAKLYFRIPATMQPVPPWSPEQQISERQRKARRTYVAIQEQLQGKYRDERVSGLSKKIAAAHRRGDARAVESLAKESQRTAQQLDKEILQRLRQEGAEKWDVGLIDLYEKSPQPQLGMDLDELDFDDAGPAPGFKEHQKKFEQWSLGFGKGLGQLPITGGAPTAGSARFSTHGGMVSRAGLLLNFAWIGFQRPADGAPALADWLRRKGCVDLKYEFRSMLGADE